MDSDAKTKIRCAVVTGGNKGIGFEICRQLAFNGVSVVLTARDVTKGLEAVENLKNSFGLSNVDFHQLDVLNPVSISSLSEFIRSHFGKLDILVNSAGIYGAITDAAENQNLKQMIRETYESAEECVHTNYYGVKLVTKSLIPLLQLSDSPRIVNVSSSIGELKNISNEKALEILSDEDGLKEENDFKEDLLELNRWPTYIPAYTISKACLNAYTRILVKEFPTFRINCLCPGYVNSYLNYNTGVITTAEGAEKVVNLALVPDDGPSVFYFTNGEVSPY
ncbi:hypothetical protein MKW98_012084 [Papaver atlanticum]|uniref:Short-chain dehydrogenase/reductase n=1 Tax=Papaver atlanticum TaxID=357466 RepID=A0AAD4XX56_9MAGN|nr:hypothetical protein MKW98_012084 [Papaver atlanticum]